MYIRRSAFYTKWGMLELDDERSSHDNMFDLGTRRCVFVVNGRQSVRSTAVNRDSCPKLQSMPRKRQDISRRSMQGSFIGKNRS